MDVLWITPPPLPLGREIRGNTEVAYRRFELEAIRYRLLWRDEVGLPRHLQRRYLTVKIAMNGLLTEDFVLHVLIRVAIRHRNGNTPFEVSSNGTGT